MTASPPSIKGPTCALATPLGSWCQQQHEAEPPLEPSRQACFHGGRSGEGMGVGGWFVHLFSSHPQGMWWRRAPAGLVPSFLFISFYLLLSLQSWLPSRQLARPLSTQPLPLLRCGVSPGPRWGLPVLLSLWSPACLPCAPAPPQALGTRSVHRSPRCHALSHPHAVHSLSTPLLCCSDFSPLAPRPSWLH